MHQWQGACLVDLGPVVIGSQLPQSEVALMKSSRFLGEWLLKHPGDAKLGGTSVSRMESCRLPQA
jgi:hypothetical protein